MTSSTKRVATFTIALPEADSELGRWMDRHGAHIGISCALGNFDVTVSWGRVHSYSDNEGSHRERWEISRHGRDLQEVLHAALTKAMQKTQATQAAAIQKAGR